MAKFVEIIVYNNFPLANKITQFFCLGYLKHKPVNEITCITLSEKPTMCKLVEELYNCYPIFRGFQDFFFIGEVFSITFKFL